MPDFTRQKFSGSLLSFNWRKTNMRHIIAAIVVVAGASFFATMGASAAPANGKALAQIAGQSDHVIQVSGGCGRWHHRNRYGHCVHD
jgi:hypothetical protein